jgi:hypothetical protein
MRLKLAALVAFSFVLLLAAESFAQQPPAIRIRGEVTKVDGLTVTIKGRDGNDYMLKLPDNPRVMALVKAGIGDIKPNSYIGVTGMPLLDGNQRAIAIHIFTEAQRGTAEGHMAWDLQPGSTMTNATVSEARVESADGQVLNLKYKDGEKKAIVSPQTPIVAYAPGNLSEVKPGVKVIVFGARKQDDGSFAAAGINFGRDGVEPPM